MSDASVMAVTNFPAGMTMERNNGVTTYSMVVDTPERDAEKIQIDVDDNGASISLIEDEFGLRTLSFSVEAFASLRSMMFAIFAAESDAKQVAYRATRALPEVQK